MALVRRLRRYGPVFVSGGWNLGRCPVCDARTVFARLGPHLRNDYRCLRCFSVPRQRALLAVLAETFPSWRTLAIYEAGPSGPSSDKLRRECRGYVSSQHFPEWGRGAVRDGVRAEDLEALTFADEAFDLVVTQDVFEHVLRPDRAFAEVARVLKPGGAHVFSVPYYSRHSQTVVRAVPSPQGGVTHLLEPDYHRGPADPAGNLVVREWGRDLPDFIAEHAAMTTTIHCLRDRRLGIDGEHREIFVSRRPG